LTRGSQSLPKANELGILETMDFDADEKLDVHPAHAFALVFVVVFVAANAISYFVLSDGNGIRQVYDGMIRVGWPFLIYERGGVVYRSEFHGLAALGDTLIAAAGSGVAVFLWRLTGPGDRTYES
jgi:hypothetical protein